MRADQRELASAARVHRGAQRAVELLDVGEASAARRPRRPTASARTARRSGRRTRRGRVRCARSARAARARSASTSTSPRSVIFSAGITDSARNESVMNGASIATPCSRSSACSSSRPLDDLLDRAVGEQAGDRQRQLAAHRAVAATTMPAADLLQRARRTRHVVVVDADHDEVVRVVGDGRGERAARAARSRGRGRGRRGPVAWWRSITAILARSRAGSATTRPSRDGGSPRARS